MDPKKLLTDDEIAQAGLEGWHAVAGVLVATYETGSFAKGLDLVNAVGTAAEEADHHPDITLTYPRVTILFTSHDSGGITQRDIDLARRTTGFATDAGVPASKEV